MVLAVTPMSEQKRTKRMLRALIMSHGNGVLFMTLIILFVLLRVLSMQTLNKEPRQRKQMHRVQRQKVLMPANLGRENHAPGRTMNYFLRLPWAGLAFLALRCKVSVICDQHDSP